MKLKSIKRHTAPPQIGLLLVAATVGLTACGGSDHHPIPISQPPVAKQLLCDDSMKAEFKPDDQTTVLLVKAFQKGEPLILSGSPTAQTPKAENDVCLVKINVGPGNPGPAGEPSTSPGIGIEVWLPSKANWNNRLHALGGGGWAGGLQGITTGIGSTQAASIAGSEGAVSSTTDTGYPDAAGGGILNVRGGSFAMNPDGTINSALWRDFASRGIQQQAIKSKLIAAAYYGSAPKYSYWEGGSTGGRQGLMFAQKFPEIFDGIIANYPATNWTRFITAEVFPQIVFQRDLGGIALTEAQQDLVSNSAIKACDVVGGQHLGYILDPSACKYDPTTDPEVICSANGGANSTGSCVTPIQAAAVNKIWYGMTSDGSVQDPAADNGWVLNPTGVQRWYGMARGTSLYGAGFAPFNVNGLAGTRGPFTVATDMLALELQNPTIAEPNFRNATGNGASGWKALSYVQLSEAFDRGIALQPQFGGINTDNPDLSAFKARGGKMLAWHGLADELIMPQGTISYYNRVMNQMGGLANVQAFYRLYLVPGAGHGSPNGTSNPEANPPAVPPGQMYKMLVDWVENSVAPARVDLTSPTESPSSKSQPICVYPQKATYINGDPFKAASYACQ